MTLDVWLVARQALELREGLTGARIQGVAGDAAGLRVACYRRGGALTLRCTFGSNGPLVAMHAGAGPGNENVAGGWAGGVAPLLRGCSVESVHAVPDDRIIFLDAVSRSAFGVPARHRIAFELEPNKANILVLRPTVDDRWQILAAAKEIEGRAGARDVQVGETYELPPPRRGRLDAVSFAASVDALEGAEPRSLTRLLGDYDPTCSPAMARESVERALSRDSGRSFAARLLEAWTALRVEVAQAASDIQAPVYAWRQGDGYGVCHLIALSWPPGEAEVLPTLNDACTAQQAVAERRRQMPATTALRKRLSLMLDRCETEIASLRSAERRADDADAFRIAGESIYTYLAQIPARADEFVTPDGVHVELDPSLNAKENAAAYFKRFKKARSGLPRIAQRLVVLQAKRVYWEELLWELDRAQSAPADELSVVRDEIADAIGTRHSKSKTKTARRVSSRTVELPGGAIAHVGKSPKDNERVTFAVGAPGDLWFHARGIPGAHVILKMPAPRDEPSDEQILAAAALAAGQSRAADANKVEVDFTQRKHVRKQGGGKTGLVWYTDFKTVRVQPRKL